MNSVKITVDIRGFWHAGAGRGSGAVLDAVVQRDAKGVPVLPGRHLKGLLRDALEKAEDWEWEGFENMAQMLFGQNTETAIGKDNVPQPGCLRVSNGCLPKEVLSWMHTDAGQDVLDGMFSALYSTAVDYESGTAKDHSLRGLEVSIPMQLQAQIEVITGRSAPAEWMQRLQEVLPLIDAVGGYRNRGLGRAIITLEENRT